MEPADDEEAAASAEEEINEQADSPKEEAEVKPSETSSRKRKPRKE